MSLRRAQPSPGREVPRSRVAIGCIFLAVFSCVAPLACQPDKRTMPLEPMSLAEAARVVNSNLARIRGTLRAFGHVDGRFTTPEGRSLSYHLDAVLFYLDPAYVRFDLKSFGDRKFLFGSNVEQYWFYDGDRDEYVCGRHGVADELPEAIPARPDQLVDALGLARIPIDLTDSPNVQRVQRIVPEYQQILFLVHDAQGRVMLEKEYWLDRRLPRLVRRVVFRDADGNVTMESHLDDYAPLSPQGPLLPREMSAEWPIERAKMRFRVARWQAFTEIGPNGVQFAAPPACREP